MKKKHVFILKIIIGIAPVSILSRFDYLASNEHGERIKAYSQIKEKYSVLFLGNSHTYNGLIPDAFDSLTNITSFNLGLPAAGPRTLNYLTEDLNLTSSLKPETLVINIGPEMFTEGADNFELFPIHRHLNSPKSHFRLFANQDLAFDQLLPSFFKSYRKSIKYLLNFKPISHLGKSSNTKGFIPKTTTFTGKQNPAYSIYSSAKFSWKSFQEFGSLMYKFLLSDKFVFIHEPPNNKLNQYFNEMYLHNYETAKGHLNQYLNRFNSYSFFNLKRLNLKNECFADIDHLNLRGARKYSLFLCQQINNREKSIHYRKRRIYR